MCYTHVLFLSFTEGSGNDELFLILSVVVVLITLGVVILIFSVLGIFCLRYQREKAKVTSIDHFTPTDCTQKKLSATTVISHSNGRTELDPYV